MSSILVTGGAGFIGSCFVRQLIQKGYQPVVLDLLTYAGHPENLEGVQAKLVIGDICDSKLVLSLLKEHRPNAIFNFAAESHVDRSIGAPSAFIQTNIFGTFNMLTASQEYFQSLSAPQKAAFRFIQISTDEVYGSLDFNDPKFNEETSYAPNSPYSASKAGADHLVRAWWHTYKLPTLRTHCTNNYGPRQNPEKLIPHMIACALADKPLPVYGQGRNIRDWIHVEDHCTGVLQTMEKGTVGESYGFGSEHEISNLELVQKICSLLDELKPRSKKYAENIQFVDDRPGHDLRYAIDPTKAAKDLGFKPQHPFEQALRETIRWYLDNGAWVQKILEKNR